MDKKETEKKKKKIKIRDMITFKVT